MDAQVVGFLFSMNWKYDRKAFQTNVMELCQRNPHRFKCIYVSIDSCKQDFDRATRDKPWFNMIWEDGSKLSLFQETHTHTNMEKSIDHVHLSGVVCSKMRRTSRS